MRRFCERCKEEIVGRRRGLLFAKGFKGEKVAMSTKVDYKLVHRSCVFSDESKFGTTIRPMGVVTNA